jgi:hypothetical protein
MRFKKPFRTSVFIVIALTAMSLAIASVAVLVRMGEKFGVPTPTHKFIAQALSIDADGRKARFESNQVNPAWIRGRPGGTMSGPDGQKAKSLLSATRSASISSFAGE